MDSDHDLVKKLRTEHPDQFMNLVKMHLSFCLDQPTDEVDCLTPQSKSNHDSKKLLVNHKKTRHLKQAAPVDQGIKYSSQIVQLIEFLSRPSSLAHEGIFRRNGKVKQQQELMTLVKEKNQDEIAKVLDSNQYSVHEVATVLKNLLSEMPEPLLIESYYPLHCSLAKLKHPRRQIRGCQILFLLLPAENASILRKLLKMLHDVCENEENNKMNALNLGIVLAPHILCPRKMSAEDLNTHASSLAHIVSFMIENADALSDLPPEFISDVRLHFTKRDNEDDSSSNASTPPVKTTVTFVDREMTAKVIAEVGLDPTEAALAELYAYVQSQPESEIKKKWVHKFNKENGCGTPKVILNSSMSDSYAKNSKNLSHSIRKHLFNGTGVTPKRRRSKSIGRSHALCYSAETSSPDIDDDSSTSSGTPSRSRHNSHRSLLESTPTSATDKGYIRHPAYAKVGRSASSVTGSTPLASVPPELVARENHKEQVISPLTQSAQRFPFYARDSIMTPRCRKPVFTFSPIDEPADDLVPHNSDALQLANKNLMQQPAVVVTTPDPAVDILVTTSQEDTSPVQDETCPVGDETCPVQDETCPVEDETSPVQDETCPVEDETCPVQDETCPIQDETCPVQDDSSPVQDDTCPIQDSEDDTLPTQDDTCPIKEAFSTSESSSSDSEEEDASSSSSISGCAPFQESRNDSLTSPFKSYLMSREMQVLNGSLQAEATIEETTEELSEPNDQSGGEEEDDTDDGVTELSTSDASILDSENPISQSLLEFLDGTAPTLSVLSSSSSDGNARSSPTSKPSPPLTKNDF